MKDKLLDDLALSNESFTNDELNDLTFSYKSFKKCKFINCKFYNMTFINSNFTNLEFKHCEFVNCVLKDCVFENSILLDCKGMNFSLDGVKINKIMLEEGLFLGFKINSSSDRSSKISKAIFRDATYLSVKSADVNYEYCEISNVSFSDCDCEKCLLYTSKLKDVDLNFDDFCDSTFSNFQVLEIIYDKGINIKE